jgi:peptidoglycan hydrolase-like protein with peptidoglycan-binding domain
MRELQLENPFMTGSDVVDWQNFLTKQAVLQGPADGVFGPSTAQATSEYQTNAGLVADGIVGPGTLARATADGFVVTPMGANITGMDAMVNCEQFAQRIADAGMKFVARYYSDTVSKTLTLSEAQALSNAGLQMVVVFEDLNNVIEKFSSDTGTSQAQKALQIAQAVGQPAGSAIYFAVDFDPLAADVSGPVTQYFQAVNAVLTAAPVSYVVGVYGSGLTCQVIRDAGLAKFTWLSGSMGFQDSRAFVPQADILQSAPSRTILDGELNIDDDVAQTANFGAFRLAPAAAFAVGSTI